MKKLLSAFAVWIALLAPALAANVNIDALPAAGSVAGTDLLECEQTGINRKCTAAQTAAYVYGLMSGDATAAGGGAVTFATVNANVGSFGSASNCVSLTVNAKGLITAASQTACAPTGGAIQPVSGTSSTVPGMTAGSAVADTDVFYASQSSGTNDRKVTGAQVKTYANTSAVRATTTTIEALANSDQNKLVTFSNAAAVACTIAQAGSGGNFAAGWAVSLKNLGAGTVTCTPTTSTVDGAANFTLTQGQGLDLYSDGTNYFTQPGKGSSSSGANPTATASDTAVNGVATTFMRSDGAPAIQKGTNAQFGLAEGDDITVSMSAGVVSTKSIDHPGYRANIYYAFFPHLATGAAGGAPTAATAYCSIARIGGSTKVTISSLAFRVTTAGTSNAQLALYNSDFTSGINRPGTLVANTGNISINGVTGSLAGTFTGVQINPGWYWICVQVNDTTVRYQINPNVTSMATAAYAGSATLTGFLTPATTTGVSTSTGISAFGTWPSFVGATFNEATSLGPQTGGLFSSVP